MRLIPNFALCLALSVLEDSGRSEFKISNLHISILELAKDFSEDVNINKVIVVCNCKDKKEHTDSKEELIQASKLKNKVYVIIIMILKFITPTN